MHYLIYKITNIVNNKIYIGKHKTENINDDYMGSGILLKRAQNLYGKNNFIKEILCECSSNKELNEKEIEYIQKYNSTNKDIGYNISKGGDGGDIKSELKAYHNIYTDEEKYFRVDEIIPDDFIIGFSDSHKKTLLEKTGYKKGDEPWNKGVTGYMGPNKTSFKKGYNGGHHFEKGCIPWNKGIPCSESAKRKVGEKNKLKKWWNNDNISVFTEICPQGFKPGRIKWKNKKKKRNNNDKK